MILVTTRGKERLRTSFCQTLLVSMLVGAALVHAAPTSSSSLTTASSEAPAAPLTLSVAVAQALATHPSLRAAQFGLEASDGAVLQSKSRPNPELSYAQEDTRSRTKTSTVQWNQLVEVGGKRDARMRIAERGRDVAQAGVAATRANIRADVRATFYSLLAAQERVTVAKQTVEIVRSAREAAAKRVAAGKVAPLEESRAKVAESGAELEQGKAESDLRVARQQMQALLGGQDFSFGPALGTFEIAPEAPAASELLAQLEDSPSIRQARSTLEQSRASADLERAKRLPDPTLSLGVKRAQEVGRNQLVFGISIPLPVLDTNRGNQIQALRLADQAEEKLQALRVQMQTDVFQAREQLETSRRLAQQLSTQVLPTAQTAYEAAVKGFSLGKFSYLDVLDAQRTWFDARSQYLSQLLSTHSAVADLERLLGSQADQ